MKVLLLFPPQWMPVSPYFALPSLMGQLKANGFSTETIDLNANFYNDILDASFIKKMINKTEMIFPLLLEELKGHHSPDKKFEDYPFNVQSTMVKFTKIKEYKQNRLKNFDIIPPLIEEAVEVMKSDRFYEPETFVKALNIIENALEIISLPYAPSKLTFDNYYNPLFKLNYESIKYHVFDRATNIFIDYYENILDKIISKNAKYVGISVNSSTQIIPGLTLANLLKTKTDAHINIGGNFFGRVIDNIVKKPEFFKLFAHSILVEEGERPTVELAKYINGEIPIEQVSNLVYLKNDEVVSNDKKIPLRLDELANVNLDGYDFSKYMTPEIVMPFQTSKGCYWGKCSFCDIDFGQNFNVKNTDKLVNELKELNSKYGISKIEFIDESISPTYFKELAQKLLQTDLKIDYFANARLETAFSAEILEKARMSGLRMILWGLESGSEKIMNLINKGIDLKKRFQILENSYNADIWNFAFIFFGFPAETKEDAQMTIDMLCRYSNIINSYGRSVFTMGKHTRLREQPDYYGISGVSEQQDEFSPSYDFHAQGMTKSELSDMIKLCTDACFKSYENPLWMYLKYREYLFLYITKYGTKWVKNYNVNLED